MRSYHKRFHIQATFNLDFLCICRIIGILLKNKQFKVFLLESNTTEHLFYFILNVI